MKRWMKYGILGAGLLGGGWLLLSQDARDLATSLISLGEQSILGYLEEQMDQGQLALERFDKQYRKASQKLENLKALKLDVRVSLAQAQQKVADYEKNGQQDLAEKNRAQMEFLSDQYRSYNSLIEPRTKKLKEMGVQRARIKEDVRLIREKIAILATAKEVLDEQGNREVAERAQKMINKMHHECNRLNAEIEVMNLEG